MKISRSKLQVRKFVRVELVDVDDSLELDGTIAYVGKDYFVLRNYSDLLFDGYFYVPISSLIKVSAGAAISRKITQEEYGADYAEYRDDFTLPSTFAELLVEVA